MRSQRFSAIGALALIVGLWLPVPTAAQGVPLGLTSGSGQGVTPAYEGWYPNPDGTFTISFGYFNRNTDQVLEIPLGENNSIEPAEFDGMQPTRFEPRRHWGVFGIVVPADFGQRATVTWTIKMGSHVYSIPAALKTDWKIDALEGEGANGNTPPRLSFVEGGPEGAAPLGIVGPTLSGAVGEPVEVIVWSKDDAVSGAGLAAAFSGGRGRAPPRVTLTWFKHQGPGQVTFSEESGRVPAEGGMMTTTATFDTPGEYILRVRANDSSGVATAGHSQCCWTNGYVKVTVR